MLTDEQIVLLKRESHATASNLLWLLMDYIESLKLYDPELTLSEGIQQGRQFLRYMELITPETVIKYG